KTIDVSKLSSGMYYIRIYAGDKQYNEKFIIAH
ncbi:MAG: T9SS type A sorting domain-containing protein, partial [Bacteroidetes bacterium]|nr:T9SS type A sorting domain-containing protein [Bacteroidota bacterium]